MISEKEFSDNVGEDITNLLKNCILTGENISLEKYTNLPMNSYEVKFIEPLISNEALIWKLEKSIKQTRQLGRYQVPPTYPEYLATDGINELLKRFKLLILENKMYKDSISL